MSYNMSFQNENPYLPCQKMKMTNVNLAWSIICRRKEISILH